MLSGQRPSESSRLIRLVGTELWSSEGAIVSGHDKQNFKTDEFRLNAVEEALIRKQDCGSNTTAVSARGNQW